MTTMQADQMRSRRDQATQRFEVLVPLHFTSIHVGTRPRQLFEGRFVIQSLLLQAGPGNGGRIHIAVDQNITPDYGFALAAGATIGWEVTLTDILMVLGWPGVGNVTDRQARPEQFNPFRQTRVGIDAGQFWVVATAEDQDLTIHYSTTPRY